MVDIADIPLGKEIDPDKLIKSIAKHTDELERFGDLIDKISGLLNTSTVRQLTDLIYRRQVTAMQGMSEQMGTRGQSPAPAAPTQGQITPDMIKSVVKEQWEALQKGAKK